MKLKIRKITINDIDELNAAIKEKDLGKIFWNI